MKTVDKLLKQLNEDNDAKKLKNFKIDFSLEVSVVADDENVEISFRKLNDKKIMGNYTDAIDSVVLDKIESWFYNFGYIHGFIPEEHPAGEDIELTPNSPEKFKLFLEKE